MSCKELHPASSSPLSSLDAVPDEALHVLYRFFSARELCSVAQTARRYRGLADDPRRWVLLFDKDFSCWQGARGNKGASVADDRLRWAPNDAESIPGAGAVAIPPSDLLTNIKEQYKSAVMQKIQSSRARDRRRVQLNRLRLINRRGNAIRKCLDILLYQLMPAAPLAAGLLFTILLCKYMDGASVPGGMLGVFAPIFVATGLFICGLCVGFVQDQCFIDLDTDETSACFMQQAANNNSIVGIFIDHLQEHINDANCLNARRLYMVLMCLASGVLPFVLAMKAAGIPPFAGAPWSAAAVPFFFIVAMSVCLPFGCGTAIRRSSDYRVLAAFFMLILAPFLAFIAMALAKVDGNSSIKAIAVVAPLFVINSFFMLAGCTSLFVFCVKLRRRRGVRRKNRVGMAASLIGITTAALLTVGEALVAMYFDGTRSGTLASAAWPLMIVWAVLLACGVCVNVKGCRLSRQAHFTGLYSSSSGHIRETLRQEELHEARTRVELV